MSTPRKRQRHERSYAGELEWAIEKIQKEHHDLKIDSREKITALLDYAMRVANARRKQGLIPDRPEL